MSKTTTALPKPLPALEGLAGEFYGFCRKGELRFQRCGGCREWRHVPRELCAECGSWDWSWEASSGRGRIFSWTVVVRALHPAFQADTPYAVVIVELEEGLRLLTHVPDVPAEDLAVDLPVEVYFEAVSPDVTLPLFRRNGA